MYVICPHTWDDQWQSGCQYWKKCEDFNMIFQNWKICALIQYQKEKLKAKMDLCITDEYAVADYYVFDYFAKLELDQIILVKNDRLA